MLNGHDVSKSDVRLKHMTLVRKYHPDMCCEQCTFNNKKGESMFKIYRTHAKSLGVDCVLVAKTDILIVFCSLNVCVKVIYDVFRPSVLSLIVPYDV